MSTISWEQAVKSKLSSLFLPCDSGCVSADNLCLSSCNHDSHVDDAHIQRKLPAFFGNTAWDLSRQSREETSCAKLPASFTNKSWDLAECVVFDSAATEHVERKLEFSLKAGDRFGMVLEETSKPFPNGLLVVTRTEIGSPFSQTVLGERGLRAGDVVVKVNGQQGSALDLRETIVQSFSVGGQRMISFVVRSRPPTFSVELQRGVQKQQRLGLTVSLCKAAPDCLVVKTVQTKGAVQDWNAAHGSRRICRGDLITHVNGISQDVRRMRKELEGRSTAASALCLCIVIPSDEINYHSEEAFLDTVSEMSTNGSFSMADTGECTDVEVVSATAES